MSLDTVLSDDTGFEDRSEETSASDSEEELSDPSSEVALDKLPTLLPRMEYSGHCNVETLKDGTHDTKTSPIHSDPIIT